MKNKLTFNDIRAEIARLESLKRLTQNQKNELFSMKQFIEAATIQINSSGRVRTRSTNGKNQTRSTGKRGVRNCFGHACGTIGHAIDTIVCNPDTNERYSKSELAALCGTKISKVNSHIRNELTKKYGFDFVVNSNGKLKTIFPAK